MVLDYLTAFNEIAKNVFEKIGTADREAFESRVAGKIGATPQTYFIRVINTQVHQFVDHGEVDSFLRKSEPSSNDLVENRSYGYEVVFGDGDVFSRDGLTWIEIENLHQSLDNLVSHMNGRSSKFKV